MKQSSLLPILILFIIITTEYFVQCSSNSCFSSLTQSDCLDGEVLVTDSSSSSSQNSGCPICAKGKKLCDECDASHECAPGLKCEFDASSGKNICGFNKESCHHVVHMKDLAWKPECTIDGSYAAKQCRGDKVSGRCFCFSAEGERIFGWDWRTNEDKMTCACSRRKHELEAKGEFVTFHCTQNGNYEDLQCTNGFCWCSQANGTMSVGERVVPEKFKMSLSCCK